jgi:pimeloyl-ACP methyl ester carboxylesterase
MRTALRAVLAAALIVAAQPLLAQDTPVVFVHGILSDGGTWQSTADRLQARLAIVPHRPTVSWPSRIDAQASTLQSYYGGLPDSTIVVGHSLGGLVGRQWTRSRRLGGVVTLGTPNQGAPFANHVGEWVSFNYSLFWAMANAFGAFGNMPPGVWTWAYAATEAWLNWGAFLADQAIREFVIEMGIGINVPFVQQVYVGSPFLAALNGSLAQEMANAPGRVSIVNTMSQYWRGGPWRLRDDDTSAVYTAVTEAAGAALDYYAFSVWASADPADSRAQELSSALLTASWWLWNFDEFWCRTVSDSRPLWTARCYPHDGFIPTYSQYAPGALAFENSAGPPHTRETRDLEEYLFAALTTGIHVPPRGTSGPSDPPPPPAGDPGAGSSPPAFRDTLTSDQALYPGERITSGDGRFWLTYQWDGNLVLYRPDGSAIWHTGTYGTSAGRVVMQSDGNLVVYTGAGAAVWSSRTSGYGSARLLLQNDGNLVIYTAGGAAIWSTNTWGS